MDVFPFLLFQQINHDQQNVSFLTKKTLMSKQKWISAHFSVNLHESTEFSYWQTIKIISILFYYDSF